MKNSKLICKAIIAVFLSLLFLGACNKKETNLPAIRLKAPATNATLDLNDGNNIRFEWEVTGTIRGGYTVTLASNLTMANVKTYNTQPSVFSHEISAESLDLLLKIWGYEANELALVYWKVEATEDEADEESLRPVNIRCKDIDTPCLDCEQFINVVLNKPVTVSSTYSTFSGAMAVDGDRTNSASRWVSSTLIDGLSEHWIDIDLQGFYTITSYGLWRDFANATQKMPQFSLQAWIDDAWVTVSSEENNTADSPYLRSFDAVTTNRVRWYVPLYPDNTVRLFELEVYGYKEETIVDPYVYVIPSYSNIVFSGDGRDALNEDNKSFTPIFAVVSSETSWDAESSQKGWLIVAINEDNSFTLTAAENPDPVSREATVTVTSGTANPVVIHVTQQPKPVIVNVVLNKPVTVSSTYQSNTGEMAVDGDKTTSTSRWISTTANTGLEEHWIDIDLQGFYTITSYGLWRDLANTTNRMAQFSLQAWINGAWVTVSSEANNTTDNPYIRDFDAVTTNRVRWYVPAYLNNVVRLYEIEVYGVANE